MNNIFESHAHYDDEAFNEDRKELLASLPAEGIEYVINVGASMDSTVRSVALAKEYDYVYAAVGVHPSETLPLTEEFIEYMKKEALSNEKVVAIGEIGLDYYWDEPDKDTQKKWFVRQLDLALEVNKPVIIHSREAAEDTLEILKRPEYKKLRGVIHCYSYSPEMAKIYLEMGYYLGVGGVVTFKNAKKLVQTVSEMPLERLLLETDCPYLSPEPNRGKRNDSRNLKYVIKRIAQIKEIDDNEVIDATRYNAKTLFGINR